MALRKMSDVFEINGQPIPEPDPDFKVEHESLADENSGRTQDGVMRINWIRRRMAKAHFKFSILDSEQASSLLNSVQGQEFNLTYIDPIEGITTKHMYCSNEGATLKYRRLYGGIWSEVTFNCIEV